MPRFSIHIMTAFFVASSVMTLSEGCKKDPPPPPPVDPGPPPGPPDAGVVQLMPLDDAGDAAPDTGHPKPHGNWTPPNANVARIRQCCAAIRKEAKNLGTAPEATMLLGVATQCDMMAPQVAANGTAPEFAQVRALLKGRTVPAACSGM
jgi:hypothetical protein